MLDCPQVGLASFENFPLGACGDASVLLGEYLHQSGEGVWTYVSAWDGRLSHAWIEKNGLRVDVTADQFDEVDEPVIIASGGGWHDRFRVDPTASHGALIDVYDEFTRRELRNAYTRIVRCLRHHRSRWAQTGSPA